MDEHSTTNKTRKTPGPAFLMAALFVYLCVVHAASLLGAGPQPAVPAITEGDHLPRLAGEILNRLLDRSGHSPLALQSAALAVLYACMICIFHLTRRVVRGPIWLGSLAAAVFMAHPAKTEVLFSAPGLYHLLATLMALLALLAYLRLSEVRSVWRYSIALSCFAAASLPFPCNATLFGVLVLFEFYPGTPESRRWLRLLPFLSVTIVANGLHVEVLYARMPDLAENFAPLLLLIYPIGLLPSTVSDLQAVPLLPWFWGLLAMGLLVTSMVVVRNGAYRVCVLALLFFRFYPGTEAIDLSDLDGGGQLLLPIAFGCIALAGFCRWLMQFEAWGHPTVALTTMFCIVLFFLQFQANRAYVKAALSPESPVTSAEAPEGAPPSA